MAVLGLAWDNFFAGVKIGADMIGITSILKDAITALQKLL
jgi:hypothetical protein